MKTKNGIKKDVSEYKNLRYQYRLFQDLMDTIPDVIYFKDNDGKLVLVNQAHAKGLGLKPREVIGKTDFDIFPRRRAEAMRKDDLRVINTGKPIIDKVERATRADGVDNYVSTTKIPRYDEKGRVVGLMGITRDISPRMQLERLREENIRIEKKLEALEELTRMKSEFVSMASHELRTPLAIIKEAVMLVFDEALGPLSDKQKRILTKAKDNVVHLKSLIDDLLDISRIERGALKLYYSLVNLSDILRDSADFFRRQAVEKGINLEYALPQNPVNIFIDKERLNQIISNLINNAVKFTERGGKIRVELKALENKVRIGVIDTGIGIAEQDLPRIFDKFTPVSKTTVTRKGLGLGLAITKELAERLNGEIWVESEPGVGSKFYVNLPRFYPSGALDEHIRTRINNLLANDPLVYLLGLSVVNFAEFKNKINADSEKLFRDLEAVIDSTLNGFYGPDKEKSRIVIMDTKNAECIIILPESGEGKVTKICNSLKAAIKGYFVKSGVTDIFIKFDVVSYSSKSNLYPNHQVMANLNIRKIYIGPEIRRYKRFNYQMNIDILTDEKKSGSSQLIDISEGGVCFATNKLLELGKTVRVRLALAQQKRGILVAARVAWIRRNAVSAQEEEAVKYKYRTGLEFTAITDEDNNSLHELISGLTKNFSADN